MSNAPLLTVVIPCYNEEKNLRLGALEKVEKFLKTRDYPWEVIVVDDGSTDESRKLVKSFIKKNPHFCLIENPHQGKGPAVITGVLAGKGKYILFTDLDQATPITELDKLLPYFKKNYDVVIGSRNTQRKKAPFSRLLMARGFIFLRSLILGLKGISDTQCGFKAFKKKAAEKIFKKLKVYGQKKKAKGSQVTAGFDVELLFLAKRQGFKIKEVPVSWRYVETRRVNPLKDSWEGFLDLIKIKINDLRGLYD